MQKGPRRSRRGPFHFRDLSSFRSPTSPNPTPAITRVAGSGTSLGEWGLSGVNGVRGGPGKPGVNGDGFGDGTSSVAGLGVSEGGSVIPDPGQPYQ